MPRWLGYLLFLVVALSLTAGIHYYFWARLVRDTQLPPPWRGVVTGSIVALGIGIPAMMFGWRILPTATIRPFAWPIYIWIGVMLFLTLTLLGAEVVRLAVRAGGVLPVENPERRLLFLRVLGGAAATAAVALSGIALRRGLGAVAIKRVEVLLARLPPSLDGMTIVQLTDVHIGPTIGRAFLEDLVRRTNALEPDVIAITGDLVDGSVAELAHAIAPLGDLRARHGVFFVTGNHEYYTPDVEEWLTHLRSLGVRVLRNERVKIGADPSGHGESIDLAGIDDLHARGMAPGHGADLAAALDGRDPTRELILLAHQPRAVRESSKHGVGLQLSGHTHAGQIWPGSYFAQLQQGHLAGLERVGQTQLYTSAGSGYWGPPMRLGTQAEITHLVLRARAG